MYTDKFTKEYLNIINTNVVNESNKNINEEYISYINNVEKSLITMFKTLEDDAKRREDGYSSPWTEQIHYDQCRNNVIIAWNELKKHCF